MDDVDLTTSQASALNASALVTVQPAGRRWRVTAAHAVGVVRVGELVVRVQPKIGTVQTLRLLARGQGLRNLQIEDPTILTGVNPDLTAVLAVMFANEAVRALALGPHRGYREELHCLPVLRGRVRLREQELRRFGVLVPVEVIFDEWTADTDDNRHIRAACRRLITVPAVPGPVTGRLAQIDRALSEAQPPAAGARPVRWRATRLNARLHRLLGLADLVLAGRTFEHRVGDVVASGFVVAMEKLFEDLIARLLREGDDDIRLVPQATYHLDDRDRLTIRPDLVFRRGREHVAVADTKYKVLAEDGRMSNADAYQLVTYCKRLGLPEGHLIYASGLPDTQPFAIRRAEVTLHVHRIDLTDTLEIVEQNVAQLRDRVIRTLTPIG